VRGRRRHRLETLLAILVQNYSLHIFYSLCCLLVFVALHVKIEVIFLRWLRDHHLLLLLLLDLLSIGDARLLHHLLSKVNIWLDLLLQLIVITQRWCPKKLRRLSGYLLRILWEWIALLWDNDIRWTTRSTVVIVIIGLLIPEIKHHPSVIIKGHIISRVIYLHWLLIARRGSYQSWRTWLFLIMLMRCQVVTRALISSCKCLLLRIWAFILILLVPFDISPHIVTQSHYIYFGIGVLNRWRDSKRGQFLDKRVVSLVVKVLRDYSSLPKIGIELGLRWIGTLGNLEVSPERMRSYLFPVDSLKRVSLKHTL
jgi:hypothetical protein